MVGNLESKQHGSILARNDIFALFAVEMMQDRLQMCLNLTRPAGPALGRSRKAAPIE